MAILFFSYSHLDENLRDQLEKHLAALRRQGLIASWHDRRITAGTAFADAIDIQIEIAEVILLLVSPDFIASDYCMEKEMVRALQRHEANEARVIPIILRPCDWHSLPFGSLLTAPTDGRPVTMWPNQDEAFLNVVRAIKKALNELDHPIQPVQTQGPSPAQQLERTHSIDRPRSSNLRIRKQFSDFDRARFLHDGFEYLCKFFENSLKELDDRNAGVKHTLRRIDANRFTCAVFLEGEKVCRGSASLGGAFSSNCIEYAMTDEPLYGGMNEAAYVKSDDQMLYFEPLGMQSSGQRGEKLSFEGVAEFFWRIFVSPLQ